MIPISPLFLFIPFGVAAAVGVLAGVFAAGARGTNSFSTVTIRSVCVYAALGVAGLLGGITLSYFLPSYINMFPNAFALGWLAMVVLLPAIWELSRPVP
ncbi:MAG: hypothetical protein U0Q11_16090 [Vicinamibacterales bacterium]